MLVVFITYSCRYFATVLPFSYISIQTSSVHFQVRNSVVWKYTWFPKPVTFSSIKAKVRKCRNLNACKACRPTLYLNFLNKSLCIHKVCLWDVANITAKHCASILLKYCHILATLCLCTSMTKILKQSNPYRWIRHLFSLTVHRYCGFRSQYYLLVHVTWKNMFWSIVWINH